MHNHNHNNNKNGEHKSMMLMMIPCFLMVAVLLFGGGKFTSSKYLWLIVIGICVVPHLLMMFKGHKKENEKHEDIDNLENKIKDTNNKHNESCH